MSSQASPAVLTSKTFLLATAIATVLAVSAQSARAQEGAAKGLEEVIVTAQKREQRLQDVPTTVTALSGDSLRDSSVTEVNQLSSFTPGIFINSDQTGRNSKIKIRGIGPDEQSNIRPAIGFFYNDIPMMTQLQGGQSVASDLDLGDLSRIEVLKGPQSTLFGESVSGGAIAFYNKRPDPADGLNGRVSATVGDHNLSQTRGAVGFPIGDQVAMRLSAYRNQMDDQIVNTVDNSRRKLSSEGYAVQLSYQPIDDLKFIIEHNRRRSEQRGGANDGQDVISYGPGEIAAAAAAGIALTPANVFDRKVQMVFPFDEEMVNELTSLHVNWNISDKWSLTSVTGYQDNVDRFGGPDAFGGYNASNGVTVGFVAQGLQKIHFTTEELRAMYSGERLNSMFGVYVADYQAPLSRGDFGFGDPRVGAFPLAQLITVDQQTSSAFTHNSFKFTDEWELVFGGRYTKEKADGLNGLRFSQGIYTGNPELDRSLWQPPSKSDVNAWGGTLKALWHVTDEFTLYGGVDRGFRLGGINNLGQPNYDTEVALNYEVGIKGTFLDNKLRFNASVYQTDYDGYQVVSYDSNSFTFITQNADVTAKGIEIETLWAPTANWEFGANLAFSDNKYDKFLGATCDNYQLANGLCANPTNAPGAAPTGFQNDLKGTRLSQSPRFSGNLTASFTHSLGGDGLEWYVRGDYAYRGSTFSHIVGPNGDPQQEIDAYGIANASLGLRSDHGWDAMLWVKNLTDKDYLTNITRQPVGSESQFINARVGMERSVGVTLSYGF